MSQAIKCPSIDYHLTTFKKFQQSVCIPETLREVLGERYSCHEEQLQTIFTGMWSLENYDASPEVQEVVAKAILNPHDFVLKPQKEGGGNNFFDDELKSMLEEFVADRKESLK